MGFFEWLFALFDPLRNLIFPKDQYRRADVKRRQLGSSMGAFGKATLEKRRRAAMVRRADARRAMRPYAHIEQPMLRHRRPGVPMNARPPVRGMFPPRPQVRRPGLRRRAA